MQSGVDQLIVEALDGQDRPPAKLKANLQMMGLDISKGTLLVFDGSRADLYRVREAVKTALGSCLMGALMAVRRCFGRGLL